jgi:Ca2+-transporting ATPase
LKVLAEKMNTASAKNGTSYSDSRNNQVSKVATLDFTSERKSMSTVVTGYKNSKDMLVKGAPDRIIERCSAFISYQNADTPADFSPDQKKRVLAEVEKMSSEGLRCLALAEIPGAGSLANLTEANQSEFLGDISKYSEYEQGAVFVGIVCIKDPVREEVKPAIKDCKMAGIRVIMITGDSKETATAIAKECDILEPGQNIEKSVFTGTQFEKMNADERRKAIAGLNGMVFSRVEPKHKRELVKCLIDLGQIVAMTGDGVNDAPALKQAHIGIAMGITGTEVAKFASDMVLADDNFATIVKAIEEGRAIYSNMKAFIRYLISSNIGEVLSIFFTAMLGIPEGFSSVQLLWVNLVTDGPPATALGFNPPDSDNMKKPPRAQDENLLNRWTIIRYSVIGTYVGCATVGIFAYWYMFADFTGDGHTLVTWQQLSHWGECPSWPKEEFSPASFSGIDLSQNPCAYFTLGKIKASTLSLSVLVMIEMLNAMNAISEDNSLLESGILIN